MKDVAREAGVSTATVSYVINNRTDIKLSDETRKKVLQIINLLDYSPNQAAQALAAKRNSTIAIFVPHSDSILVNAEDMISLRRLVSFFNSKKNDVILLKDDSFEKCDKADTIVCFNTSKKSFFSLGNINFIPLIALDCIIDDPLFFQINSDPEVLKTQASDYFNGEAYTYLCLKRESEEKELFIRSSFESYETVDNYVDLNDFSGRNLLITDSVLYSALKSSNNVLYVPNLTDAKLEKLNECISSVISKNPLDQHNVLV
jgi:hypothetical protein